MRKQLILYIVCFVVAIAGISIWAYKQSNQPKVSDGNFILYYSDSCPHCKNVEEFMANNKVGEKLVGLQRKEAMLNTTNAEEMLKYAKKCNLPLNMVGFPFLWTGTDCLMGDQDIIQYFTEQISNK